MKNLTQSKLTQDKAANKSRNIHRTQALSAVVGKTDFKMYNKFGGYGKGLGKTTKLSLNQMKAIDKTLPCPHNPDALSELYLKGENKLKLEEHTARKS